MLPVCSERAIVCPAPRSACRWAYAKLSLSRTAAPLMLTVALAARVPAAEELPDCAPAGWHEVTSPAPDPQTGRMPVVSGVVSVERVLHITAGPPGGCPTDVASSSSFRCPPSGSSWDNDLTGVWWETGVDAPLQPRELDTTEWCYPFKQGMSSQIFYPLWYAYGDDCSYLA